jgi:AraC-like DNA-binding protein
VEWSGPQPVAVRPVLAELINYLASSSLDDARRARAEALLFDLLEPVAVTTIDAPLPADPRARAVAEALQSRPDDARSLAQWGRAVGASARTLARAFVADTGIGFERWPTLARLRLVLPRLAAGQPISTVARHVGYRTPSAFVAAFRRETGVTPGEYFHRQPRPRVNPG